MRAIFIFSLLSINVIVRLTMCCQWGCPVKQSIRDKISAADNGFADLFAASKTFYETPVGTACPFSNNSWLGALDLGEQLHIAANICKAPGNVFNAEPPDRKSILAFSTVNSDNGNR